MTLLHHSNPPPATKSSIIDVTMQNFMQEVLQASLQMPVLLYFTASWCGPCKQFGPLLEKVISETKGKVKLARADIDQNKQLAAQFRVQSVPMVFIVMQGQPVDAFAGALPESQLRQLVKQLLSSLPEDEIVVATLEEAERLRLERKIPEATRIYEQLLQEDPSHAEAAAGLTKCLLAEGKLAQAEALLQRLPEDKQQHEAVLSAKASLALIKQAGSAEPLETLAQAADAQPHDHQAQIYYAVALFAAEQHAQAIERLLGSIKKDRQWNDGAARQTLLTCFEALGHTHPLTMQGRRQLSSLLFS